MINDIFVKCMNMSYIATYVVLAIILIRLFLKKSPKIFSYMLWGIVFLRMVCPFSFRSIASFMHIDKNPISKDIGYMKSPVIHSGVDLVDNIANNMIRNNLVPVNEVASVNPMQIVLYTGSIMWIMVIIIILLYSVLSYVRLLKKVRTATIIEDNIYETDRIRTPFVLGILKPRIYLPQGIKNKNYEYIISHEKIHIKRKDYIIKPLFFLAVVVHWFNPFMWLSYYLMTKDMEMACDEKVMKLNGYNIKADYANLLLNLSVKQSNLFTPIAFGENSTKLRIKNVIKYKKPKFWIILITLLILIVSGIGLMSDPMDDDLDLSVLNIAYVAKVSALSDKVMITAGGRYGTVVSGKNFADLIYDNLDSWKEKKVTSALEFSSDLSVYLSWDADISEIQFYDTESIAMIIYDDNYRYYNIPKNFYDKVHLLSGLSSYKIPEELINVVTSGNKTNIQSVNETPVNIEDYYSFSIAGQGYYIYEENNQYYCEKPYLFIKEISEDVYKSALQIEIVKEHHATSIMAYSEIEKLVEENLDETMSSPKESSNPRDYIDANYMAYETIIKYGGEEALSYMLMRFEEGNVDGLRGEIMMALCKELLGVRNNVDDDTLLAKEWFKQLKIREKVELPDFEYQGDDPIEKLLYHAISERHTPSKDSFMIIAPHIFGSYEDGDQLKIFATIYLSSYKLYNKTLSDEGGSMRPVALTYVKNADSDYVLEVYEESMDGSYFNSSIKEFCTMPISGKKINGLADEIINYHSDHKDIIELERKNLIEHLKKYNQYGISIHREHYKKADEIIPIT